MAHSEAALFSLTTWATRLGTAVADLLFPPHCVECHRYGVWFCSRCVAEIDVIRPPLCNRCGLPIGDIAPSQSIAERALAPLDSARPAGKPWICQRCKTVPSPLDAVRAYAFHGGPLRTAIHEFKYSGLRSLATILGELMGRGWAAQAPDGRQIDVVVPVPLHATRQKERGFNQAALLGRELAACLQRPVVEDVLVRSKPTPPQVGLGPEERRANVDGAFRCAGGSLSGTCVLLVDDVYTTGSTLEAACSALLATGVQSVWAYTLARAGGQPGGMSHISEKEAGPWN